MLPAAKVSQEIAEIRGIPVGMDCASPSRHAGFHDVDSMLDFVELIAAETGLPVGIKSAVGNMDVLGRRWSRRWSGGGRGVDFVNIDGGEGGTGAAPMIFADSVAFPFRIGFAQVYGRFAEAGLTDDVTFIGAGKLGLPENAVVAFALGADMVNVGREAMLAIGCIQAQKCHTDHCPTGVATQNPRYTLGLDPDLEGVRCANYVEPLRRDLLKVSEAVGVVHPGLITPGRLDILDGQRSARSLHEVYGYEPTAGARSAPSACASRSPQIMAELTARADATARPADRTGDATASYGSAAAGAAAPSCRAASPTVGELVEERAGPAATSCSTTVLRIARIRRVGSFAVGVGTPRASRPSCR